MNKAKYISSILYDNSLDENSYLNNLPVIKYLAEYKELKFSSNITFFVGENGTGKSTLLEAIAVAYGFNAEGGTRNFSFSTKDTHSELSEHLTLIKRDYAKDGFFLRAESLYNAATYIDEVKATHNYGYVSLHNQSHGESFLSIVQNRFSGKGLYLLDEPEAALSPMRLMTLIVEIDKLLKNNSQFIIATHSPILMAFPNAEILQFSESGIGEVKYYETEHYKTTKLLIEEPEKTIHYLIDYNN